MSRSASSIDNNEYVLTLKAEDIEFEATGNPSGLSRAFSESSEIPFMNDEPAPISNDEAAPFFPSDQDQREDISVDDDHAINNDGGDNDIDQISDEENDDLDHQELVFLPNVDDEYDDKENDDKSDQSLEENLEFIGNEMAQQQDQMQQNTSLEDILSNEDLEKKNSINQEDLTEMLYEEVIEEDGENRENLDNDEINNQTAIEEAFKILHRDDSMEEDNESNKCMKLVSAGKETDENKGRQNFVITCVNDKVAEANRIYKTELARVQRKVKEIGDTSGKLDTFDEGNATGQNEQNVANNIEENQEAVIEVEDEIKNEKSSSRDSSPSSPESSVEEGEEKPTSKEKKKRNSSPAVRNKRKRSRSNSPEKSSHKTKLSKKKSSTDKKRKGI
uniref:Uncharacterized protein n=1 Tax=Romanomermis culicivorax TaxID=13658 RepID=A0A915KTU1_ROMCU